MSILSDKYKIPEMVVKSMIKDGVISCSWALYDDVRRLKREGKSVAEIADTLNISLRYVYKIINCTK